MSQYLGNVSAYAYAVEKGYTGTEEEFAELMASYATVGQTAVTAAQTATTKASEAATSATTATNKASEATTAATTATTKASEASQSAQTASTKASEASQSASTASTKASQASQSASQALTYKTAAESAKTASQTAQGLAETAQTAAETAQGLAEDARDLAQQYAESIDPEHIYSAYPTDTAEGSIASFADGADDIPLKSLVVNINPVQSGSGDPSPDNVRPISGHTQAVVTRTGVNVWDEEWEVGTYDTTTGAKAKSASIMRCKNFIAVLPSTTYFINASANTLAYLKPLFYDSDYSYIGTVDSLRNVTLSTPANACYMTFYMNTSYGTTYNNDISINYPATDTDYHEGHVQSITIPLGQTVYGGKLDVLSGVLTVDRAMVDLGTLTWNRNESLNLFYTNISNAKYVASPKGTPCECSALASARDITWSGWSNFPDYAIAVGNNFATGSYSTTVKMSNYDSPDAFKTAMSGVQLCYELAAPITIQLTPHEVKSLYGQNNIFADTGDSSVEYRADTKLYIERLTEPDADMIADANIVSGQYFLVGNSLYLATSNIASGGQVIVGTNATRKSLSEALNEINS